MNLHTLISGGKNSELLTLYTLLYTKFTFAGAYKDGTKQLKPYNISATSILERTSISQPSRKADVFRKIRGLRNQMTDIISHYEETPRHIP